jgi:hypothetical protein
LVSLALDLAFVSDFIDRTLYSSSGSISFMTFSGVIEVVVTGWRVG